MRVLFLREAFARRLRCRRRVRECTDIECRTGNLHSKMKKQNTRKANKPIELMQTVKLTRVLCPLVARNRLVILVQLVHRVCKRARTPDRIASSANNVKAECVTTVLDDGFKCRTTTSSCHLCLCICISKERIQKNT